MKGLRNLGKSNDESTGPWERRLLTLVFLGAVGAVLVVVAAYSLDAATESDRFCGTICHAMRPEYVTHEVGDHVNVDCATCHVGPGLAPKIEAKLHGVEELIAAVTNSYDRPIAPPVEHMRPAAIVCEQCHTPQWLDDDRIRTVSYFAEDEQNSETQSYLILRADANGADPNQEPRIHWHIANPVSYVARDAQMQDIPWVSIVENGELVEYRAANDPLTAQELARMPRRDMDCLDCHNRAVHQFSKPERLVDEALAGNLVDRSLPYLKREALNLLSASYSSEAEALKAIRGLEEFYRSQYPSVYGAKQGAVLEAVEVLQDIYSRTTFPEMNLSWESYADNLRHSDFPACFRCHDGEHLNAQGEAIPADCNTCHSIPDVTRPGQEPDESPLSEPAEGERTPQINLVRLHLIASDVDSVVCQACHEEVLEEADVSPEVRPPHPAHLQRGLTCTLCHKSVDLDQPSSAGPETRVDTTVCAACHRPGDNRWYSGDE